MADALPLVAVISVTAYDITHFHDITTYAVYRRAAYPAIPAHPANSFSF